MCCLAYPGFLSAVSHRQLYARSSFADLYHYHLSGQYQRYLIHNANLIGFSQSNEGDTLSVEYIRDGLWGAYSHLHEAEDEISLNYARERLKLSSTIDLGSWCAKPSLGFGDGMELGWEMKALRQQALHSASLYIQGQEADLDYRIGNEHGSIPFTWINAQGNIAGRILDTELKLTLRSIIPTSDDSLFSNRIKGFGSSLELQKELKPNLVASLYTAGGMLSARLNYRSEEYGKLDNLGFGMASINLSKAGRHLDAQLGLSGALTYSGDDTYFDIWPFTFWDTFLASRTRFKKLELQLLSPQAGLSYHWGKHRETGWQGEMGLIYNHLLHHEDVIHKNRIVVMYPFFFDYETFHYDWHDKVDACVRVPLSVCYNMPQGNLYLNVQQVAPFRWSKLFRHHAQTPSAPSTEPKSSQWGGLAIALGVCWAF